MSIGFVITCRSRMPERTKALEDTWLNWLADDDGLFIITDGNVSLRFNHSVKQIEQDGRYVHFEWGTKQVFKSLQDSQYEWVFLCDDDTFVWVNRLKQFLSSVQTQVACTMIGCYGKLPGLRYPSGGAGMAIKRDCINRIVDHWTEYTGFNDVSIGIAIESAELSVVNSQRFTPDLSFAEGLLTTHRAKPEDMRRLYAGSTNATEAV